MSAATVMGLLQHCHTPSLVRKSRMGRSYLYECPKCGYRAKISGKADRGVRFMVRTMLCRDCKELYDVVTRLRVPDEAARLGQPQFPRQRRLGQRRMRAFSGRPPSFLSVLNQLPAAGAKTYTWIQFTPQCPVSAAHRVQEWSDPGKCPKCGVYLERGGLPYRIWD